MPSSWDGLKEERLKKESERKEITGILFHAQAVNYQTSLLLPNMLNCLHICGMAVEHIRSFGFATSFIRYVKCLSGISYYFPQ